MNDREMHDVIEMDTLVKIIVKWTEKRLTFEKSSLASAMWFLIKCSISIYYVCVYIIIYILDNNAFSEVMLFITFFYSFSLVLSFLISYQV